MPHSSGYAPLIIRVAGLPSETMAPFSHPLLIDRIAERERLREQLDPMRASLVDCLHQAIHGAAREERRFLLAMKRRCFSGEKLAAHRKDLRWPILSKIASTLVDPIVAREEAIAALDTTLDELYRCAVRQEQESIIQLSESRSFMRGVTLASPVVGQNVVRLTGREIDSYGRREKKLCLTLLRYASRAALKLSPFATLTRTAIGRAVEDTGGFDFVLDGSWQERSTVCLHRELLHQYTCLLQRCRRFAESLPIAVNETLVPEGDGRYRFFRPNRWVFDDDSRAFRHEEASFVRVKLEGPLLYWLLTELRDGPRTYCHLYAELQAMLDDADPDSLAESLAELLCVGFLNLVVPWDTSAPDLEQQILDHLDGLPDAAELEAFRNGLRKLTEFLHGYADTGSPARFLGDGKRSVEGLFQALATSANLLPQIEFKAPDNTFEEDVFLLPSLNRTSKDEVARIAWDRMQDLIADLDPLARLAHLHSSHHDLLHALAAFGDRRWPGAAEVDFLEFFASAQLLFEEYVRYRHSPVSRRLPAFNPLELESVTDLVRWRQRVEGEIAACFDETAWTQRLCPRALASLLDQVPAIYANSRDFCAFVQPLSGDGQTWVVNSIGEGYGRYGARFTASMDYETRERWASYFVPLSTFALNGEQVELIDMSCPGGRTIDVHVPQTLRVLKMPGEHSSLPAERVLRLRDLRVHLHGADRFPVLADPTGQRLLPIQLGSSAAQRRPTMLKFLAAFGPGELQPRLPVKPPRREHGVEMVERHLLGSAVYTRKKWLAEMKRLLPQIDTRNEVKAFASINSWRLAKGIPDRVFALESVAGYRHKPQYIDFSSPSFVQVFRSILKADARVLALEEALPAPEQLSLDGSPWTVEVQLESFCFRHQSPRFSL